MFDMGFLESLVNGASDAILVASPATGKIVYANPAAYFLFECDTNYLIGKHQSELHPPEDMEFIGKKFQEFVATDNYLETRANILTQNQKKKSVLITSANLFENEGEKYAAAYFKDLTHLDRLREIAYEQSHVIRSPLSNILGITNLLLEESKPEDKNQELLQTLKVEVLKFDEAIRRISDKTII